MKHVLFVNGLLRSCGPLSSSVHNFYNYEHGKFTFYQTLDNRHQIVIFFYKDGRLIKSTTCNLTGRIAPNTPVELTGIDEYFVLEAFQ